MSTVPLILEPQKYLDSMSIEQKLGQMFTVELNGWQMDDEFSECIAQYHFGTAVLSGRNLRTFSQVSNLNREIRARMQDACAGVPAMLAIDEEGGHSSQFPFEIIKLPGNFALGAARDVAGMEMLGQILGNELSDMGFSLLLGPVLDLSRSETSKIIGTRSYGANPQVTAALGTAFAQGVAKGGCGCTFKHFPGYGDIRFVDEMPCNTATLDELLEGDIHPFAQAIQKNALSIMVGHIGLPGLHKGSLLPASVSEIVIDRLLRRRLGFRGVVIVDGAVASGYSPTKSALMSIKAGTDIILHNSTAHQISVYKHLYNALCRGKFSEEELNAHVLRILTLKLRLAYLKSTRERVSDIEKNTCLTSILKKSITLLRDPAGLIPLPGHMKKALIISPVAEKEGILEGFSRDVYAFGDPFALLFEYACVRHVPMGISPEDAAIIAEEAMDADIVIIGSENADEHPGYLSLIDRIAGHRPTVVVSMGSPREAAHIHPGATVLGAFTSDSLSMAATADVLRGRMPPLGRLPGDP